MTERDGPMTPKAFHALFGRIGARAKMQFPIHPHMLRHGCGYALANAGHDTGRYRPGSGTKTSNTPFGTPRDLLSAAPLHFLSDLREDVDARGFL